MRNRSYLSRLTKRLARLFPPRSLYVPCLDEMKAQSIINLYRKLNDANIPIPLWYLSRRGSPTLFVKYIYKRDEFKVFVVEGRVVRIARKTRERSVRDPDWSFRKRCSGWVYSEYGYAPQIASLAERVVNRLGDKSLVVKILLTIREELLVLEVEKEEEND